MKMYIDGYLAFKEDAAEEEKYDALHRIHHIFRGDFKWTEKYKAYFFHSIVDSQDYSKMRDVMSNNKEYIRSFECDFYNLETANDVWEIREGKWICDYM